MTTAPVQNERREPAAVPGPDFAAAEIYLAQAKAAQACGDVHRVKAACRMVAVALDVYNDSPRIHLGHLK